MNTTDTSDTKDTTTINLRDMPGELARKAKVAAAIRGVTLKEFVLVAIERALEPTQEKPDGKEALKETSQPSATEPEPVTNEPLNGRLQELKSKFTAKPEPRALQPWEEDDEKRHLAEFFRIRRREPKTVQEWETFLKKGY